MLMSNDKKLPRPTEADFDLAAATAEEARHERGPTKTDPTEALRILHAQMAEAGRLYADGDLADQRMAVLQAVCGVYDMLVGQGFGHFTLDPLFRPIDALEAQFLRSPDPLFAEKEAKGGRPVSSGNHHRRVGTLAALANFWIEHFDHGERLNQKLSNAARRFRGRWFGTITKAQLIGARVTVSQESSDHPAVQTAVRVTAFLDRTVAEFGIENALTVVIRTLNDAPRTASIGNWNQ
jgi:hypothetical protein